MRAIIGPGVKLVVCFSGGTVAIKSHFWDYDYAKIAEEIYNDESKRAGRSFDDILAAVRAIASTLAL